MFQLRIRCGCGEALGDYNKEEDLVSCARNLGWRIEDGKEHLCPDCAVNAKLEEEWVHVEYEITRSNGVLHLINTRDLINVDTSVAYAPEFHGRDHDHIFDGFKHVDLSIYPQFVMWGDEEGCIWPYPEERSEPITATHVRFRVYKNGLPK